ncbi:MAG: acyl-CoA/acyl-ACP dehydrogenase, partial [Defluviicoccus sp.]|nr:acyl-CoA/acyl-ACP dehydrogenase [Defluviicoccus sp.]
MDLILSQEQRMLRESAVRLLARAGGAKRLRRLRESGDGFDRKVLREMAAEGWLGVLVPADRGGLGLGMTEAALLLEQAGRALAPEPVGASMVAAAALAACEGNDTLLARALSGDALVVPAVDAFPDAGEVRAIRTAEDAAVLDGSRLGVPAAAAADGMLVAATGPDGPVLCHVEADAKGLRIDTRRTVDGASFGDVAFDGVAAAPLIPRQNRSLGRPESLRDGLLVAVSAELLGAMDAALEMTLEYLRTREQFGRPLGAFQALQHRAVDDFTRIVGTRSLLFRIAGGEGDIAPAMAAALKAHASESALRVTKSAIQMHGAIAFTDEHDAGLHLKRAMTLSAWLGNAAAQRERYA